MKSASTAVMLDGKDALAGSRLDCTGNGIPDECAFSGCPGNLPAGMNCDDERRGADIASFVATLVTPESTCQANMDRNGFVTPEGAGSSVGA